MVLIVYMSYNYSLAVRSSAPKALISNLMKKKHGDMKVVFRAVVPNGVSHISSPL